MDLGFFRRGTPAASDGCAAPLDYRLLTATLHAWQSASATARAQTGRTGGRSCFHGGSPLIEILLGAPGWKEAVVDQNGSFNTCHAGSTADG